MSEAGPGRRLEGKNAIVTGGSRGLGASIARRFAAEGANVAVGIHLTDMMGSPPPEVKDQLAGLFLLGLPDDGDVAAAAAFLASRDGDHMSAQIITTNGGSS